MEFNTVNKTFVKSHNSVKNIYLNYTYSLMGLVLFAILFYLIFGYTNLISPLIKSLFISFLITSILAYLINIFKKEYNFLDIYTKDYVHLLALIIGLCSININYMVMIGAILLSLIVKNFFKKFNLSAALFGLLFILLYRYFTNDLITPLTKIKELDNLATYDVLSISGKDIIPYLVGTLYISPILSIIAFIFLFYKRSIKYNIVISYIATFSFVMFIYGIINGLSFWFVLFQLSCGNILFYTVFLMTDYMVSPTIKEGQMFYGIMLGLITSFLRFVMPEFAVITAIILGQLLLVNYIDKISYKFKYNHKLYNILLVISMVLIIIVTAILSFTFNI